MDIRIQIGTVAAGAAGCETLPVYLRELDGDCGPVIQVGNSGMDDFEFDTLEAFWTRWAHRFTAAAPATEPPAEIPAPANRFYCPDCKGTEVHVTAQYEVRIVESGDEVETRPMDGHWDWDEDSSAWCGKCDFVGTAGDFDHDPVAVAAR